MPRFAPMLAMLMLAASGAAQTVTFSDGALNNGEWVDAKVFDTTAGSAATFTASQETTGGNPGSFRQSILRYGPGVVWVSHVRTTATYDPRVSGAIGGIDFSYDAIHINPPPGQAVGHNLIFIQNGTLYRERGFDSVFNASWTRFSKRGLVSADFIKGAGPGPEAPDFSPSGSPIQFGYLTLGGSNNSQVVRQSGVDNFSVTVFSLPLLPTANCVHFPGGLAPFDSVYYLSQPNASGDRLLVGRLGANGAAIQERVRALQSIPLPNGNAAFCSPVQLAPGRLFDAYVPSAAQRNGDFSDFSSVLLDPLTNRPFPNGIIPANRLGDPYAWRVHIPSPAATSGVFASQSGLTFNGTTGGPAPPGRSVDVVSLQGDLDLTVSTSTFRGQGWLNVTPSSGTTPAALTVQVDPRGLPAGDYYGEISIAASGSPSQLVTVVFSVAGANVQLAPAVEPAGLVFAAAPGTANPASQSITVTNLGVTPVTFNTEIAFPRGEWFTLNPARATVQPGTPVTVAIQPNIRNLSGVYPSTITFTFSNETTRTAAAVLIVAPGGGGGLSALPQSAIVGPEDGRGMLTVPRSKVSDGAAGALGARLSHSACNPTALLPVSTLLGPVFSTMASWPVPLEAIVVDDCAHAISSGALVATFNNGDPPVSMVHTANGRWAGTWTPRNPRDRNLVVTLDAVRPNPPLYGTALLAGSAAANPDVPTLVPGGLLGAASFTGPPAPGAIVSLFGGRMADATAAASSLPLPIALGGSNLFVGGRPAPLIFTSDGQINAVLPYDVPVGTRVPVVVRRGFRQSVPEQFRFGFAQPAVFTLDQSGGGQGHIYVVRSTGEQLLANTANPASNGDFLVIYASGLGSVSPPVAAGVAAPLDLLSRTTGEVAVTINGVRAEVLFAGLTPGFTGLYQINTRVPGAATPGEAILQVSVGEVTSPPVKLVLR